MTKILYTKKQLDREIEKAMIEYDRRRCREDRINAAEHRIYELEMKASKFEASINWLNAVVQGTGLTKQPMANEPEKVTKVWPA